MGSARFRPIAAALLIFVAACGKPAEKPAQIIVGEAGTLIVNSVRPTPIAVAVLDKNGQSMPAAEVKFRWKSGDPIAVTSNGIVTCARSADAFVHASLAELETDALIRCRPVSSFRIPGPMQLRVGDTAQAIPVDARDPAGKPVSLLSGSADIVDTLVAVLNGFRVRPRKPGSTQVQVKIGDRTAVVGVHVY